MDHTITHQYREEPDINMSVNAAINKTTSNVPEDLRQCPQWVNWRLAPRPDGKLAKIPIQPNGLNANVADPKTWHTFEACLKASPSVGFVLTSKTGLVVIDLDHVRSKSGAIESWALAIVQEMDSYTEISPSGTGLHIWLRGTLPPGGRRKDRIEVYCDRRYMTVTGKHLPTTPCILLGRQDVLTSWHERVFGVNLSGDQSTGGGDLPAREDAEVVKALSKPDHKWWIGFDDLYHDGDLSRWSQDFSRGLFTLALMVARFTRDASQVERIIKASKVYRVAEAARKKWDAPRGQTTWGSQLIASAMRSAVMEGATRA
jgi:putative DNA primase/helicase